VPANLIYLFEVIDVDASGEVSWEEFLDFCAEAGDWKTKAVRTLSLVQTHG
jgi:Ca2+-binding EF-hand superfamily protein